METGFPHFLTLENRFQAMTSLCLHGILLSRKAELDQFVLGLGPLVDIIKQHPKKWSHSFWLVARNCRLLKSFFRLLSMKM
jgi:hypothetical protein